jgi:predicted transcriptional regulator
MESTTKATVLRAIEALPDEVTLDEVIERLVFLHKVQRGLAEAEAGQSRTLDEVEAALRARRSADAH